VQYIHPADGDPQNWVLNEFTGEVESRDQTFSAKLLTDLELGYHFPFISGGDIRFSAGANNLLNVYPDAHTHSANVSSGRFVYSRRVQQFGVAGRFVFIRSVLKF